MTQQIEHPALGSITGLQGDGVIQFLGVPYATLEHRFAQPQLIEKVDVPEKKSLGKLPVFVFLHGGGFVIGSNAWPQYNLARMVKLSTDLGTPIIGVNVNYRLGAFGFLASSELQSAGFKANRGIRDQQAALRWVKKFIIGFGGDPGRITVVGESAGGVSATLHLLSEEPLFKQLVSMGGTSLLMKPLPPPVTEWIYAGVLKALGLSDLSVKDRIEALLNLPATDILTKVPPTFPLIPALDGDVVHSNLTFADWRNGAASNLPGYSWCKRAMIGDCQYDGSILAYMLLPRKAGIAESFRKSAETTLPDHPSVTQKLIDGYNITPNVRDDEAMKNILHFATDIAFYAPAVTLAQAWPANSAYLYHFNEPNPWDGSGKGEATHILDVAFLFQNYNEKLSDEQAASARAFAADMIAFVNENEPFQSHGTNKASAAQVYGIRTPGGVATVNGGKPEDYGRRSRIWDLAREVNLDQLAGVWDSFVAGR
ncbi:hypothetical protein MW887_003844 [Aspergillus wentii]|nr:hypothetical protein MW887_003844 [Aspergillus wentii]